MFRNTHLAPSRRAGWLSVALAATVLLAACAPPQPGASAAQNKSSATAAPAASTKSEKVITIGMYQEPSALFTAYSNQTFTTWLNGLTMPGLWMYGEGSRPSLEFVDEIPSIENGMISKDGKVITIKLKKGLKWSDGELFTSTDIKFTFEQIMKPANTGIITRNGYDQVASVETPDAQTAIITFKAIYAPWMSLVAGPGGFLPMHLLKDVATLDGNDWVAKTPVTLGAYKVTNVVKGDRIELAANDNYWRGRPKIDKINVKIVESREAAFAGLRSGDLDVAPDFIENSIPDFEGAADVMQMQLTPSFDFEHYFFNLGTTNKGVVGPCPFRDVRVRKAIMLGIDRYTIVDKLLYGKTRVIASLWPNSPFEDTNLKPYPFDPEQAKALLDEAGYKVGTDGIRAGQCDGQPVKLSFKHSTTSGNALRQNVQTLVQQNMKDIGIEFVPDNYKSDVLFGTYAAGGVLAQGNYEMGGFTTSFMTGADPDPSDYFKAGSPGGGFGIPTKDNPNGGNWYRLENAELDRLTTEQSQLADTEARKKLIFQIQKIMYDEVFVIPLYARLKITGASKRMQGLKISPTNTSDVFWNPWEWDVSQ